MASKSAKKTVWVDCERCKCTIPSNDKIVHLELSCKKDQVKCPYVEDGKLYTWMERSLGSREGIPTDAVMIHPSTASLIGAVIGCPILLSREGAPTIMKRMWPSKISSPAVVLPAAGHENVTNIFMN